MGYEATRVRLRYIDGVFRPMEPIDLPEGTELEATIPQPAMSQEEWRAFLDRLEGAWGDQEFEEPEDPPIIPERIFPFP